MDNSFFDPVFFKHTSKFKDFFTLQKVHSILKQNWISEKEILFQKLFLKWKHCSYKKIHVLWQKTPKFFANPFLLDCYTLIFDLYVDEQTGLSTNKNPLLKNNPKIPQYADDNLLAFPCFTMKYYFSYATACSTEFPI